MSFERVLELQVTGVDGPGLVVPSAVAAGPEVRRDTVDGSQIYRSEAVGTERSLQSSRRSV